MTPVGPDSSMRPPKARTLSPTISSMRGPSPGDGARSRTRRKARRRRCHCGEIPGGAGRIGSVACSGPAGRARPRCRRPYLSIRARSVLREMPSAAAVRRMLPPLAWRAASIRARRASSRDPGAVGIGVSHRRSDVTSGSRASSPRSRRCRRAAPRAPWCWPARGRCRASGERRGWRARRTSSIAGRQPVVGAGPGQKVVGQEEDVRTALAQRRQLERDDREPMVEILAEATVGDRAPEIDARRGHDERRRPARPGCFPAGGRRGPRGRRAACPAEPSARVRSRRGRPCRHARSGRGRACCLRASVKAPRSYPNSSASSRVSGIAAQLTSTNGPPLDAARPGGSPGRAAPCRCRSHRGSGRAAAGARRSGGRETGRPVCGSLRSAGSTLENVQRPCHCLAGVAYARA